MTRHVLVVDDEARFRDLYRQVLQDAGLSVSTAASAEEALAVSEVSPPDLVVSDVKLPGMDGVALLREARTRRPELPFLLVTAYADVRDAVAALPSPACVSSASDNGSLSLRNARVRTQ